MTGDEVSIDERLGVTNGETKAMKRLRRRQAIGRTFLSVCVGFTAGFLPVLAIVAEANSRAWASYPYVAAVAASAATGIDSRKPSVVRRLFSIPFLLLGILAGMIVASGFAAVPMYGVHIGH